VPGWSYTSCTGALMSLAQSVSVAQHDTCPPLAQHIGPVYMIQASALAHAGDTCHPIWWSGMKWMWH